MTFLILYDKNNIHTLTLLKKALILPRYSKKQ